jgi:peptide deformylase
MTKRDILILPDPMLRKVAVPITVIDAGIQTLASDMLETMYEAPGVGLAAPQVGVLQRLIVCDVAVEDDEEPRPMTLINPEVVWASEERRIHTEGCLSIPEFTEEVERPSMVRVAYVDLEGKPREVEADGLLATCLQHEIDHLDGVLFIDRISRLKRERIVKKFQKQAKLAV